MLRKIRIILALVFLAGITLLLVGIGREWWGWMASLQLLPSFLALNLPVMAGILILTLLLGRLYCSIICPMGVFQDIVIWLRRVTGEILNRRQARRLRRLKAEGEAVPRPVKHASRFSFKPEHRLVRFAVLALTIAGAFVTGQLLLTLLAPYSAYGRMVRSIAGLAEGESMAPALLVTAAVTLVLIFFFAWTRGRAYCNTICPVGSLLSIFSRFSLFRLTIDESKCVACKRCGSRCKASCIDTDRHYIDGSRCVLCFDCIDNCSEGAISLRFTGLRPAQPKTPDRKIPGTAGNGGDRAVDSGRRNFIATGAAIIGTGALAGSALDASAQVVKRLDGGFADVADKKSPQRRGRIVPYGAWSVRHFYDHCTACQLCVSSCPNDVLRPSTDLEHFLQPQMGYENGWCRPECTACSEVCPTDAIHPIKWEEKLSTSIGKARVNLELCFAATDREDCGNCVRHCPTGAVHMIKADGYSRPVPVVAQHHCIGCGACEFLCPSRPISAITVDGIEVHESAVRPRGEGHGQGERRHGEGRGRQGEGLRQRRREGLNR